MTAPISSQQSMQVPNYSGVNIQIFNPSVNTPGSNASTPITNTYNNVPSYPSNYYTNNYGAQPQAKPATPAPAPATTPAKKTEKRDVVELTDDYIKNVESYLNSQSTDIRLQGGNEVISRLKEDESRKSDPALNALVNKMLQDPVQKIRLIGMSALESNLASGNNETVQILKNMQQQKSSYGEDALEASSLLLKMSGNNNKVKKEFEVKDKDKAKDVKKSSEEKAPAEAKEAEKAEEKPKEEKK